MKRQITLNELKQRLDSNSPKIVKREASALLKTKLSNRKSNLKHSLKNIKV
jgi:hypothetical protein